MDHFSSTFENYKKNLKRVKNREAVNRYQNKQKETDPKSFKQKTWKQRKENTKNRKRKI